jgi:hypothetical protein
MPIINFFSPRVGGDTAEYQSAERSLFKTIPALLPFLWLCSWYELPQYDLERVARLQNAKRNQR